MPGRALHYTAARALDRATGLIETKGADARDDANSPCAPTNPVAECFCTQGAVMRGVADPTGCGMLLRSGKPIRHDGIYFLAKRALALDTDMRAATKGAERRLRRGHDAPRRCRVAPAGAQEDARGHGGLS